MKIEVFHLGANAQNGVINKEAKRTNTETTQKENRGEDRQENRQFRNRDLQDLIRILLIRELLRRRRRPPMTRPPFPPRPPITRPPFPRGGYDPMGPIAQARDYDIYENY